MKPTCFENKIKDEHNVPRKFHPNGNMNFAFLKSFLIFGLFVLTPVLQAQETDLIQLNTPDLNRGSSVMTAFQNRASANGYSTKELSLQDISDLLWAANGINRPGSGKRTAPSAMNSQDIDIYTFFANGVYLYDAPNHQLHLVTKGDHRNLIAASQPVVASAPIICLLVSDISRFKHGSDSLKLAWAANDAGIVSQNICLFCAGTGLVTRTRAYMEQDILRALLKLKPSQHLMLNNPVAYKKE